MLYRLQWHILPLCRLRLLIPKKPEKKGLTFHYERTGRTRERKQQTHFEQSPKQRTLNELLESNSFK